MSLTSRIVAALAGGLLVGALVSASKNAALVSAVGWIEPLGGLWVNAIRMTVVPLVVSLLIGGVASVTDLTTVGRLGARTLLTFVLLLLVSAALVFVAAPPIFSLLHIEPATTAGLHNVAAATAAATSEGLRQLPSFGQWFTDIVPTNPIKAAADGAMLPLVVFSILFAVAIAQTGLETKKVLLEFFRAVAQAMLVLVRWVIQAAPIGVFALALGLTTRVGVSAAGALGFYVVTVCAVYLAQILFLYSVATLGGHVPLHSFAKALSPAQAVAFSTRSSLASLPALIDAADRRLQLPSVVTGFVLPLAVSIFKISIPITSVCGALFLSRIYGVPISGGQLLMITGLSVVLSFSTPGIPMGGLIIMAPVFTSFGLPAEGIGILIAVDVFPDAVRTTSNVTADLVAAILVSRHYGKTTRGDAEPAHPGDQVTRNYPAKLI